MDLADSTESIPRKRFSPCPPLTAGGQGLNRFLGLGFCTHPSVKGGILTTLSDFHRVPAGIRWFG